MKEFLRKNAKIILTIVSIALMFVFALPTFRNKTNEDIQGQSVGTLNGKKVTQGELVAAKNDMDTLSSLGVFNRNPLTQQATFPLTAAVLGQADENDRPAVWLMLGKESAKYAHAFISFNEAMDDAGVDNTYVTKTLHFEQNQFTALMAQAQTIENYISMTLQVPQSLSELDLAGDRFLRKVQVTAIDVDGAAGWQSAAEPTEDQIKSQFAQYKSVLPTPLPREPLHLNNGIVIIDITRTDGPSHVVAKMWGADTVLFDGPWDDEHRRAGDQQIMPALAQLVDALVRPAKLPKEIAAHFFPVGYRFPDRSQVEWLKLDRADIRKLTKPTEDDVAAAYRYFHDNPDDVKKLVPATAPATTSAPATTTAPAAPTFDQVKAKLIDQQIDARVTRTMKRMLDQMSTHTQGPWKNGTPGKAAWVNYQDLAKELSTGPDFGGYVPEYHASDRALNEQELDALPGIGEAMYVQGQQHLAFHHLAVSLKELVTLDKSDPAAHLGLTVGADGPVLTDSDGNQYIYRVSAADPAHDAASLDDPIHPGLTVRAQVIEDFKKISTYKARAAQFDDLIAKSPDLSAAADQFKAAIRTPDPFSRAQAKAGDLPLEIAGIRGFADKAFELKDAGAGKPAAMSTVDDDETMHLSAMRLVKFIAADPLEFSQQRIALVDYDRSRLLDPEVVEPDPAVEKMAMDYFSVPVMAARMNFKLDAGFKTKPPETAPGN